MEPGHGLHEDQPRLQALLRRAARRTKYGRTHARNAKGLQARCPVTPCRHLERPTGFEPATSSLGSWHSATELRPLDALHLTPALRRSFAVLERHVVGAD